LSSESKPREAASAKEMRLTIKVSPNAGRVILVALLSATAATAQEFGSVDEGRRFAHEACAQCHGVEKKEYSTNPQAPAFGDIANIPGMTSTALNIALTAPYFHSGQTWDLRQAVAVMGASQLGIQLTSDDVDKITAFLDSLTGDQPKVTYPVLPPSVGTTPRPQP
jgi:mono/diheme cytochrome c family protein